MDKWTPEGEARYQERLHQSRVDVALAEWGRCLRILDGVSGFLDGLNRNAIRLSEDFPEVDFQAIKLEVDDYLYPETGLAPYERLETQR